MSITTLSSRALHQNVAYAKQIAEKGPVYITRRGKPEHVLLTIKDFQRLNGQKHAQKRNIVQALSMPGLADIDFDPPRLNALPRAAEFD